MKTDPNAPAFPRPAVVGKSYDEYEPAVPGISRREYFAAMAMQGLICSGRASVDNNVTWAVEYADALIEELDRPQQPTVAIDELLYEAVKAGIRMRGTAIIDDDFPEMAHTFDSLAKRAVEAVEGRKGGNANA